MTLDYFTNVQEDILVQVEFRDKPLPVPITGAHSSLIIIASILIVMSIMFVIYKMGFIPKILKR